MFSKNSAASNPWRRSPFRAASNRIAFGQTYEDCAIELRAFKAHSRVFAIAGAGSTARALAAAGHDVTAVDINPQQLAYAQSRTAGPAQAGTAERLLAFGRSMARLAGWSRGRLAEFLSLSDCQEQTEFWDRWLDTRPWRAAVDTLLSPPLLALGYAGPFVRSLPRDFGRIIRERLRRGWATHANRSNPYAASLLLGTPTAEPWPSSKSGPPAYPIRFACADAAEFLENSPPSAFDAFALSNIGDGASAESMHRLQLAVEHAAAPDAVIVWRTFLEPCSNTAMNLAAKDRSLLWGALNVCRVADDCRTADFGKRGQPCSI